MTSCQESSTVARVSLTRARALLSKHHPEHIAGEILGREIAAGNVRYWPDDPDLAAYFKKMGGQNNPDIMFAESGSGEGGDWIEFYIRGERRTFYPIEVALDDVLRLLPEDARILCEEQEEPEVVRRVEGARILHEKQEKPEAVRRVTAKEWITAEAQRLKRLDPIPADLTTKTGFAKLLADNMGRAAAWDHWISIRPVKWTHIKNNLQGWGLWPISAIQ